MSKSERRKIAEELGIRVSDVTDDVVSDYRKATRGRRRKAPDIVLNLKEAVPAIRIFGGRSYRYYGFERSKVDAEQEAKKLRKSGWFVRIVPGRFRGRRVYNLYRDKKPPRKRRRKK